MPREPEPSGLSALFRAAPGDFLEEADREEVAQAIDAGVVGSPAVLLVELAQPPVAIAAATRAVRSGVSRTWSLAARCSGSFMTSPDPWCARESNRMSPQITFKG